MKFKIGDEVIRINSDLDGTDVKKGSVGKIIEAHIEDCSVQWESGVYSSFNCNIKKLTKLDKVLK